MQRVWSRGEDAQLLAASVMRRLCHREVNLGTFGPADPVRLHCADRFWPIESLKGEELIGVVGDLEEPLRQIALGDLR